MLVRKQGNWYSDTARGNVIGAITLETILQYPLKLDTVIPCEPARYIPIRNACVHSQVGMNEKVHSSTVCDSIKLETT